MYFLFFVVASDIRFLKLAHKFGFHLHSFITNNCVLRYCSILWWNWFCKRNMGRCWIGWTKGKKRWSCCWQAV